MWGLGISLHYPGCLARPKTMSYEDFIVLPNPSEYFSRNEIMVMLLPQKPWEGRTWDISNLSSRMLLPFVWCWIISVDSPGPPLGRLIHHSLCHDIILPLEAECVALPQWCWNWWHINGPWNVEEVRMCWFQAKATEDIKYFHLSLFTLVIHCAKNKSRVAAGSWSVRKYVELTYPNFSLEIWWPATQSRAAYADAQG